MAKHLIYYFSGTGNSLWTALCIQKALGDCKVIFMGTTPDPPSALESVCAVESFGAVESASAVESNGAAESIGAVESIGAIESVGAIESIGAVESIGFVFPCYGGGLPAQVIRFLNSLEFSKQADIYYYAIVTHGSLPYKSALGMTQALLLNRGVALDFAAHLKCYDNYVIGFDLSKKVAEKTALAKTALQELIPRIVNRETAQTKQPSAIAGAFNKTFSKNLKSNDAKFNVDTSCDSCKICAQVCPVQNIEMQDGQPSWLHHCEQCLACLHWCPQRSINYGEKTRARGRYTHPEITIKMFISNKDNKDGAKMGSNTRFE